MRELAPFAFRIKIQCIEFLCENSPPSLREGRRFVSPQPYGATVCVCMLTCLLTRCESSAVWRYSVRVHAYVCTNMRVRVLAHGCMHARVHAHVFVRMLTCVCVCACLHVCVCTCLLMVVCM